ncbi:hypothetical protein GGD66_005919 [Bradyrhizobium sp. CIR48]|uniref:hypothetical protein n=1 Tax=Bradyrhizobium sp. CIR48 TaxID=2663840 RepID=UPI0016057681|nr:hypothetical protein [Bradyrhizobium sp. CIR48]MBB4427337.1 hypothetical protein [Bradyrhizobium sp. CIR48]
MTNAKSASVARRNSNAVNLVNFSNDGHRPSYNQVLTTALARLDIDVRENAREATTDFFPIIDDNIPAFLRQALLNMVRGRRTVGLFFRPAECFLPKDPRRLKRLVFTAFKYLPNTAIISILPFEIDKRFETIATDWIFDPQFWDADFLPEIRLNHRSGLADQIHRAANGRTVLIAMGAQNGMKGFDFFARLWCEENELRKHFLFVAAGAVAEQSKVWAERFNQSEGLLFDRFVSNPELFELYDAADAVWSCYAPYYNQSSGVFGRAFQLAKPSVVREGSLLVTLAEKLDHPCVQLPFDEIRAASRSLSDWRPKIGNPHALEKKIDKIRKRDLLTLAAALAPSRTNAHTSRVT